MSSHLTPGSAIETENAPRPSFNFSQGKVVGGLVQIAGQGGLAEDPSSATNSLAEQTVKALENVRAVLVAAGIGYEETLMVRVYLSHEADFTEMSAVYDEYMAKHCSVASFPCRTTVAASFPNPRMLIEIDALAVATEV